MVTTPKDLYQLADRVEALEGPCREIDALIWIALKGEPACYNRDKTELYVKGTRANIRIGWVDSGKIRRYFSLYPHYERQIPAFTASVDAALTLVPKGCRWALKPMLDKYIAAIVRPDGTYNQEGRKAKMAALAIISASLRERAKEMED